MSAAPDVDHGASDQAPAVPPPAPAAPSSGGSEPIKAVGRAHPWRWVGAAAVLAVLGLFGYGAASNDAYHWDLYWKYLFDERISRGALVTLELAGIATAAGLIVGVSLAMMRTSANPVLKAIGWFYVWFFRGIPLFVQLLFWGLIATIYQRIDVGVPFAVQIAHVDVRDVAPAFTLAAIGLSLYAAAALAQTARAALLSVDAAQGEAAAALGMTATQTMRRVVLPQALRAMLPGAGNDVIALLKATALVVAIPLATDLLGSSARIGERIDAPAPLLLVAATWYLGMASILMIGQALLERRYGRGASQTAARRSRRSAARSAERARAQSAKAAKDQAKADEKSAAQELKETRRLAAEQDKAAKRQAKADAQQARKAPAAAAEPAPADERAVASDPGAAAEAGPADPPAEPPSASGRNEETS